MKLGNVIKNFDNSYLLICWCNGHWYRKWNPWIKCASIFVTACPFSTMSQCLSFNIVNVSKRGSISCRVLLEMAPATGQLQKEEKKEAKQISKYTRIAIIINENLSTSLSCLEGGVYHFAIWTWTLILHYYIINSKWRLDQFSIRFCLMTSFQYPVYISLVNNYGR